MGRSKRRRQGTSAPPIVAFDFDGTLSFRDSFLAFLAWRSGPLGYLLRMASLWPAALVYLLDRDRGRLKAAVVGAFLRGIPRADVMKACESFADSPLGTRLIRPDAEQCWDGWRKRGATMVIVSASPEELLAPFARRLKADVLIATRLAFYEDGRLQGGIEGKNCRGLEKVRRLRALFGTDMRLAAAYGDSSGDREMLEIADEPGYRVFKERT
jgi:phosphatidylglycerophosphatase C